MMPPDPRLETREAGAVDVPVIAALHAACFGDGTAGEVWSEPAIARILALPGAFGLLAAAAPRVTASAPEPAGFLLGRALVEDLEVLSLGVPKLWRGQGVARALLGVAIGRARTIGAQRVLLEAAEDNAAACALYTAEGFTVVGRRPAYYRRACGPAAAALVFARSVAESGASGHARAKTGDARGISLT